MRRVEINQEAPEPKGLEGAFASTGAAAQAKADDPAVPATSVGEDAPAIGGASDDTDRRVGAGDEADETVSQDGAALINDAYRAMASRRKKQVKSLEATIAELRANVQSAEALRVTLAERLPKIQKRLGEAEELEQRIKSLEFQIEHAKKRGWTPPDMAEFEEKLRLTRLEQKFNEMNQGRQAFALPPAPPPPPQAPPPPPHPAPAQPSAAAAEPDQVKRATDYFVSEFGHLSKEIPGLEKYKQDILNRWWNAGGEVSVEDAAQDFIEDFDQKYAKVGRERAARARSMPRAGGKFVRAAELAPPPSRDPAAAAAASGRRGLGLDAVAAAHLKQGAWQKR